MALNKLKIISCSQVERSEMSLNDYESKIVNDEYIVNELLEDKNDNFEATDLASAKRKIHILEKVKVTQSRKLVSLKKKINLLQSEKNGLTLDLNSNKAALANTKKLVNNLGDILKDILSKNKIYKRKLNNSGLQLLKNKNYEEFSSQFKSSNIIDIV